MAKHKHYLLPRVVVDGTVFNAVIPYSHLTVTNFGVLVLIILLHLQRISQERIV